MPVGLEKKWCLNEKAIPLKACTKDFVDLNNLTEEGDQGDVLWNLLELKATSPMQWLEGAFGLGSRWWLRNGFSVPLVAEILQGIDEIKKGIKLGLPRFANAIVAISVRDKTLFVVNNKHSVSLAFKVDEEDEGLAWFVEQVEKDLEKILSAGKKRKINDPLVAPPRASEDEENYEEQQDEGGHYDEELRKQEEIVHQQATASLVSASDKIKAHPEAHQVHWIPARQSFKIILQDKTVMSIRVSSYNKLLKKALLSGDCQEVNKEIIGAQEHALNNLNLRKVPACSSTD